jgi:dienelactone hydrolase
VSLGVAAAGAVVRAWSGGTLDARSCDGKAVPGFNSFCFVDSRGKRHQIYATGEGPPVLLLHELPGLIDTDLSAAQRLAKAGYAVVAPLFFGEPGGNGHALRYARKVCGEDDFSCNSGESTSPHVAWLLDLLKDVHSRWPDGRGVGVIGMCLTGAFPLALMQDPTVVAPVLLQPTVPFNIWTRFGWFTEKDALGVSNMDLASAKGRRIPILGVRYQGDWRCRKERFERLAVEFPQDFYRLDLPGNHHSTIGGDFCDQAFDEILSFLNQYLRTTPDTGVPAFPRRTKAGMRTEVLAARCDNASHH